MSAGGGLPLQSLPQGRQPDNQKKKALAKEFSWLRYHLRLAKNAPIEEKMGKSLEGTLWNWCLLEKILDARR